MYKPDDGGDIWIMDIERGGNPTRFTFDPARDDEPVWSPKGDAIAFVSNRDGGVQNVYRKNSAGVGEDELLLKTQYLKIIDDWSPDGRYILYEESDPKNKFDLWILPLFGDHPKPMRFLGTPFNERAGTFSPDERWIAYESDESGTYQVYVQSFPASGRKWQISTKQGFSPRWSHDGKTLFYDAGGPMMAVGLTVTGGDLKASVPRQLFTGLQGFPPHPYDIDPLRNRFLVDTNQDLSTGPVLVVVLNWKSGLKQ